MKANRLSLLLMLTIAVLGLVLFIVNWNKKLEAPRRNTQLVEFTIGKNFTLDAVISDLKYFDFVKEENAFRYALEHSKDNTQGNENSLRVGDNTIDREAKYTISQSMTAWQIAEILLNKGEYASCERGCPDSNFNPELLQGGDLAPTIQQKYEWVKTYDDCLKSIGQDGGQLSSEQYAQRTGIRRCISPDSREFTKGKDGWAIPVGG